VLPGTGGEGARDAGQRLRAAVRGLVFGPDLPGGVTISVGVASFDGPEETPAPREPAELVRRADEALYRAKAAGRDQVSG
jgi:GGDEF domain-containing protein